MTYNATPGTPQGLSPFGDWFGEVFRLWGARWQVWVGQGAIFFAFAFIPIIAAYIGMIVVMIASSVRSHGTASPTNIFIAEGIFYAVVIFFMGFGSAILVPGMVRTALKQLHGEEISVGDIFSGLRYFWGALLVGLLTSLGLVTCIGVYILYGLLFLALPLMIDRKLRTSEAISLSWNTATRNFWLYVLFGFIVAMLASIGASFCIFPAIITVPFLPIAQAVAYERTFNAPSTGPGVSPTVPGSIPPPPYIPSPPTPEVPPEEM